MTQPYGVPLADISPAAFITLFSSFATSTVTVIGSEKQVISRNFAVGNLIVALSYERRIMIEP